MKKLIISFKNSTEVLSDFKNALKSYSKKKPKEPHYEISFDTRKSFEKFASNIYILSCIISRKPSSIYELSKILDIDLSNLNKVIIFFEEIGALQIKRKKVNNREVKIPIVDYDEISIDLKVA